MKKFHKRAAVFLTAATLAGLPAGAFFYSSPGSRGINGREDCGAGKGKACRS